MATTMPPRALPSSLVSTSPVTPTASLELRAPGRARSGPGWHRAPAAPRAVRSHPRAGSRAAPSSAPPSGATGCAGGRRCRRAARRSRAPARPAAHRTPPPPGPPPAAWAANSAPARSAHTFSCSMAAARKVSPAASSTLRPSSAQRRASLPMVVVLPEPFTPTTRMTNGRCARSMTSGRAQGVRMPVMPGAGPHQRRRRR